MNRHGKAALVRLTKAGVKLDPVADADIILKLHEMGEAADAVAIEEEECLFSSEIESRGMTFSRLSIAARRFLSDEIHSRYDDDETVFLAHAWVMSLPRKADVFAPYRGNPKATKDAMDAFARSCALVPEELAEIVARLTSEPENETAGQDDSGPSPVSTIIELLVSETGLSPEYWIFEASEDTVRLVTQRIVQRKIRENSAKNGAAVRETQGRKFNAARKKLMNFEAQVRKDRVR